MSLLSRLAARSERLNNELTATDALALLLADPVAADVVAGAVRAVCPTLPAGVRFTGQRGDDDGRPDIVGLLGRREVLYLEGKFWAGLTDAQARGAYLDRLRKQRHDLATDDAHLGTLVFVVPPRRAATLMEELARLYSLGTRATAGSWWSARTTGGQVVAVTSWEELLVRLTEVSDRAVAEDARQLLDLVRQVDHQGFVPWTVEQRTDQDVPRRIMRLAALVETVYRKLLTTGVASSTGRRRTITAGGPLAFGIRMRLGTVVTTLRVHLDFCARFGRSPLWLTFWGAGADAARRAFGDQVIEFDGWTAVPVELPVGRVEEDIIADLVAWLTEASRLLDSAAGGIALPDEEPEESVDIDSAGPA